MSHSLAELLPSAPLPHALMSLQVSSLVLDSRDASAGALFLAVPGTRHHGKDFVDDAIRAGAVAVVTQDREFRIETRNNVPVICMPELHAEVGEIAARYYHNPGEKLTVIGITGTNGKTSVAFFVFSTLSRLGHRCGLIGTLGMFCDGVELPATHTTPDPVSLQKTLALFVRQGVRTLIIEVSSHAMSQHRLAGTPVSIAVFTNLSRDHLDYHGNMENYLEAKARLFQHAGLTCAVINADDPVAGQLRLATTPGVPVVDFGLDHDSAVYAKDIIYASQGLDFQLCMGAWKGRLRSTLLGTFNVYNLLATAAILKCLDIPEAEMLAAMVAVESVPGRMQRVTDEHSEITVIVDYAHTPDALSHALDAVRKHCHGYLWCVFGCGGNRDKGKRAPMAAIAVALADRVVITSDNPRDEDPMAIINDMLAGVDSPESLVVEVERDQAIDLAVQKAMPGDVVLIAGKGHETYQEMAGCKRHFDDRQYARQALMSRSGRCA